MAKLAAPICCCAFLLLNFHRVISQFSLVQPNNSFHNFGTYSSPSASQQVPPPYSAFPSTSPLYSQYQQGQRTQQLFAAAHYGYPSPEQRAQIPAPPIQQQQQAMSSYSPYSQQPQIDWRNNQQPDWRYQQHYRPDQPMSNNNNLPYSPLLETGQPWKGQQQPSYGSGAQQQMAQFGQQGGYQLGQQQLLLPHNQRDSQSQFGQQQNGVGIGPLNPQYQANGQQRPIVFPEQQHGEQQHSSFWPNAAPKSVHRCLHYWLLLASLIALMSAPSLAL